MVCVCAVQMWLLGSLVLLLLCVESSRARVGGRRKERAEGARSGRFTARDGSRCSWTAGEERTLPLRVSCKPGRDSDARGAFTCEYVSEPSACAADRNGTSRFWKQIARALAKHSSPCGDERAVLRAGMCSHATHFKLVRPATEEHTTTTTTITSTERPESAFECTGHYRLAQEKCGEAWASICTFFFTLIQSEADC